MEEVKRPLWFRILEGLLFGFWGLLILTLLVLGTLNYFRVFHFSNNYQILSFLPAKNDIIAESEYENLSIEVINKKDFVKTLEDFRVWSNLKTSKGESINLVKVILTIDPSKAVNKIKHDISGERYGSSSMVSDNRVQTVYVYIPDTILNENSEGFVEIATISELYSLANPDVPDLEEFGTLFNYFDTKTYSLFEIQAR